VGCRGVELARHGASAGVGPPLTKMDHLMRNAHRYAILTMTPFLSQEDLVVRSILRGTPRLRPLPANAPRVPRALMRSSREPFDADLQVRQGTLPPDLQGHMFVMAPAGSVEDGRQSRPGDPLLAGDGTIYRLDLDTPGVAHLKMEPSRTPDFFADRGSYHARQPAYSKLRFSDFGLGRLSFHLGMRNALNTAFVPMRFPGDAHQRMLVTTDDGRPYEIDPATLDTVTPIGRLDEWRALIGDGFKIGPWRFGVMPFPLVMGTAHPVYDSRTSELFTVNYGRATSSLFGAITQITQDVETLGDALRLLIDKGLKLLIFLVIALPLAIIGRIQKILYGNDDGIFTYLMRFTGSGSLERWRLVQPDGSPVAIRQTLHQMAITRDYLVLLDASFKFSPDQMFNTIHPFRRGNIWLERLIRDLLTGPQMPDTRLYIVRRADLVSGQNMEVKGTHAIGAARRQEPVLPTVVARLIEVNPEALHFLADYENPEGRITLHVAHGSAACLAEWLRDYDQSAYPPYGPISPDLLGLIAVGQMDISRHGRYVIDGERGMLLDSALISRTGTPNTFNIAFYTFRDNIAEASPPAKLEQIYWMTGGFWPEVLTKFIYDLYANYRNRTIPLEEFQQVTNNFKPTNLYRLDARHMELVDHYTFPDTHNALSPQFIPRKRNGPIPEGIDPATDGYIICTVLSGDDCSEFWVFDAANLAQPLCILGHPELRFGLTIHTAWTAEAAPRTAGYHVNPREDFGPRVKATGSCAVATFFERYVYPYCDQ
jgi:carotenoid cleavage dioxygenase-like enzyme